MSALTFLALLMGTPMVVLVLLVVTLHHFIPESE